VCALLEWAFDAAGAPGQAVGALFQVEDVVAYTLAARLVAPALNVFSLHDVTAAVAEAIEAAVGKGSRTGEQPPRSSWVSYQQVVCNLLHRKRIGRIRP
jgi:hypothetical protein